MSTITTTGFGYDYVFRLASQLPPEERVRLVREMDVFGKEYDTERKNQWGEYTVPGEPMISRAEIEEFKRRGERRQAMRTPEELEKKRQELLEILLNCPVMTNEELQGIRNARKEIEQK